MEPIDVTYKDYAGCHYTTLLSSNGTLGMTTQKIVEFFKLAKTRINGNAHSDLTDENLDKYCEDALKAARKLAMERLNQTIGTLHLKAISISPEDVKRLRIAGVIPKESKNPKLWSLEQVEAILKASPNRYTRTNLKRLQSIMPVNALLTPEELVPGAQGRSPIEAREDYEQAKAIELLPDSYTSKCIKEYYPKFIDLVGLYSKENKASERLPSQWRILGRFSMFTMISYTLSLKYNIRTDVKILFVRQWGKDKGELYEARLYPKDVIDKFMAEHGIEKVVPRKPWQYIYARTPFIELPTKVQLISDGTRWVVA